jgi:hypothetical protein
VNYRVMFKGDYISAVEFEGKEPTLTIAGVKIDKLESDDGKKKDKGIVRFKETDRCWVMNRTNAEALVAMWGTETDAWIGKQVTLFAMMVKVGPKSELGIRVKGSPSLTESLTFDLKLPRKKPTPMTLVPTKAQQGKA